jgi:hypothetical protein
VPLSFSALALRARFALLADRLAFQDVLFYSASLTLSQNLDASIVNDGFSALDFQVGWSLGTVRGYLARLLLSQEPGNSQHQTGRRNQKPIGCTLSN